MSKGESGSWKSGDDGDSGSFGKVTVTESQANYIVGSEKTGEHCHMWKSESGSGVVHRGECKVCEDSSGSSGDK